MENNNNNFRKQLMRLYLLALMAIPFCGIAQSAFNEAQCISKGGSYTVTQQWADDKLSTICQSSNTGGVKVTCRVKDIRISASGGVYVNNATTREIKADNSTEKGLVNYTIVFEQETEVSSSYNGYTFCGTTYPPGVNVSGSTITGVITGSISFHKPLTGDVAISGSKCFEDTISLRTNSDFANFVCKWEVQQNGLTPTSPTNEWAVSYELTGNTNLFNVTFTVSDTSVCASPQKTATTTIGTSTIKPILNIADMCVPIGTTTVDVAVTNNNPTNNYTYHWISRIHNAGSFTANPTTGTSTTYTIGNASGYIVVKAVGVCDTATAEVLINRELSTGVNTIWSTPENCIYQGDTVRFSINPTIEENIVWHNTSNNWTTQVTDNTGTLIAKVNSSGTVTAKSEACPNTELSLDVEVLANATINIVGNTCLEPNTDYTYSVNGASNDATYAWYFTGNGTSSFSADAQPTFRLPAGYKGTNGKDSLKVKVTQCGKDFYTAIAIYVEFTGLDINIDKTCMFANDPITFTIPAISENIQWSYAPNMTEVINSTTTLKVEAPNAVSYTISAKNAHSTCSVSIDTVIQVLGAINVGISAVDTCLSYGQTYSFTATSIPNATYAWTIFGQSEPSITGNMATGTVPAGTTNTNVRVDINLCGQPYSGSLTVGFTPATPDPINVAGGKSCVNVGMGDTLYVSIPTGALGANSHNWTATYSNGTSAQVIHSNGKTATVIIDSAGYGDTLKIQVAGTNDCGDGQARELTMAIKGIGTNYSLVTQRIPMPPATYAILTPHGARGATITSAGLSSTLSMIEWSINGTIPVGTGQNLYVSFGGTPTVSALLIPSTPNQCKSKINL